MPPDRCSSASQTSGGAEVLARRARPSSSALAVLSCSSAAGADPEASLRRRRPRASRGPSAPAPASSPLLHSPTEAQPKAKLTYRWSCSSLRASTGGRGDEATECCSTLWCFRPRGASVFLASMPAEKLFWPGPVSPTRGRGMTGSPGCRRRGGGQIARPDFRRDRLQRGGRTCTRDLSGSD
jgi:hypothetical protein